MRRVSVGFVAALLLSLPSVAPASAGTLDQQQTITNTGHHVDQGDSRAQTFTAGLSGGLDQVDVWITDIAGSASTDPLTIEIWSVAAGAPGDGSQVLASRTLAHSEVAPSTGSFTSVTFSRAAPVTAGIHYAIVAYAAGDFTYGWGAAEGEPYPAGEAFTNANTPPSGPWDELVGDDFAFRTYVAPTPLPLEARTCKGEEATLTGTDGNDVLTGTDGRDVIAALGGDDTILGLGGDDLICAGDGPDSVFGGPGDDSTFGQGGRDKIVARGGDDRSFGNSGKDTLVGNAGTDRMWGGAGADKLKGLGGGDHMRGGGGDDTCFGGSGADSARCEEEKSV